MIQSAAPERDNEVFVTRYFDAPRDLGFRAWTEPEHLVRWYAPRGCSIDYRAIDPRPGGAFHSCIRSPEGHECWCKGVYREFIRPERLVCTMEICNEKGESIEPVDV